MAEKNDYGVYPIIKNERTDYDVELRGFIFYFSSEFYRTKFNDEWRRFLDEETIRLYKKYDINLQLDEALLVALYISIEKRGFSIYEISKSRFINREKFWNIR